MNNAKGINTQKEVESWVTHIRHLPGSFFLSLIAARKSLPLFIERKIFTRLTRFRDLKASDQHIQHDLWVYVRRLPQ
ncbi:hypothetical protein KPH14_007364 [Odynerus spinipes]|uniref:Uncharacterized protein n=1 Tax=Odynerus spinipes TaxID=1348599 RepID=A0AAD9VJH4_9HYME|nr:hypothetical protein KPH14_007364 [Odynerus spinipes]